MRLSVEHAQRVSGATLCVGARSAYGTVPCTSERASSAAASSLDRTLAIGLSPAADDWQRNEDAGLRTRRQCAALARLDTDHQLQRLSQNPTILRFVVDLLDFIEPRIHAGFVAVFRLCSGFVLGALSIRRLAL